MASRLYSKTPCSSQLSDGFKIFLIAVDNCNSNLFSLVEFRGLNKLSSIHRAYMNGQFGALPNIIM